MLNVSIVCFSLLVNAAAVEAAAPKKSSKTAMTFDLFIQKLVATGSEFALGKNIGKVLGFPESVPTMSDGVSEKDAADNLMHECYAVTETQDDGKKKPVCLLLLAKKKTGLEGKAHWFRVNLDGSIEKSLISESRFDENGNTIKGSGVTTHLDPKSPEVIAMLKRELDFWFKRYSPPPAPPKPAKKKQAAAP